MAVTPNLHVPDIAEAVRFWTGVVGLAPEEMGLDWVARCTDPATGAHVQLVTHDATAPEDSALTVKVDDVDAAWAEVLAAGVEVVHPLVTEPWGVRRFFVRAPGGVVVNIAQHHA
ncbi:VOC family protein [Arthrobacter sp. NEB 688]|uniref:VOC family protein n=1 Tax=Arthrobacter sp. NEB 688 TaxID=904039 RepID=UPI001598D9F0|nr:VOC family protein [Arthrobacter sp. NEB 688]QKE84829.1 glyoxalase [Arthrobacter sp. NEB 688]